MKNQSFKSNDDINLFFKRMFPECSSAQSFTCGETKTMYLAVFGMAPHFAEILESKTCNSTFTLMFDESLNKENQMKQLDMYIRIWDGDIVRSRYLSSAFLGHSTAFCNRSI